MRRVIRFFSVVPALLLSVTLSAQDPESSGPDPEVAKAQPLFSGTEPIAFTIKAPFESIFKERSQESEEFPAELVLEDGTTLPIQIQTRGKFRLQRKTCNFPPIRLNIRTSTAEGTVFESQDKLKLVTHCQNDKEEYQQYVLKEYVQYRTLNLLTDLSFRVRLANITYVNTEKDDDPVTDIGFVIEDEDMMAARNGWTKLDIPAVPPDYYAQEHLAMIEVFEYMVGNTDFSAFMRAPDDNNCCHNLKPVGDMTGPVYPVPYDFDFSGIVEARYATPDPVLREKRGKRIRKVRDRLFRGRCASLQYHEQVVAMFNENKDAIYALYQGQEGMTEKTLENSIEYLDDFYEVINDEGKYKKEFVEECRDF